MDRSLAQFILGLSALLLVSGAFLAAPSGSVQAGDVSFSNTAGDLLRGRLYAPAPALPPELGGRGGPRPGVILCHGAGCSKEILRTWAETCAAAGFVTLAFDFAGHGESEGAASLPAQEEDLRAALSWLRAQPEVDAERIGLGGHSLGALAVVQVAQDVDDVRAAVMLAMNVPVALPASLPPNLFLGVGAYDEVHPPYEMRAVWDQATPPPTPPLRGEGGKEGAAATSAPTPSDFHRGTACRLIISPTSDHSTELTDALLLRETVGWFAQALGVQERHSVRSLPPEQAVKGAVRRAVGRSLALLGGWLALVAGPLALRTYWGQGVGWLAIRKLGNWEIRKSGPVSPASQPSFPCFAAQFPSFLRQWWSNLRASPGLWLIGGLLAVGLCGWRHVIPPRTAAAVLVLGLGALPVANVLARQRSWPRSLVLGLGYASGLLLALYLGIAAMGYHHWRSAPADLLHLPQFLVTAAWGFPLTSADFLTRTFLARYTTAFVPKVWLFVPAALELLWPGGALGAFLEFAQRFRPVPRPSWRARLLLLAGVAVVVGFVFLDLARPPLDDPGEWRKVGRMLLAFLITPGVIFAALLQTRLAAAWQRWGSRHCELGVDG